MSVLVLNAGSSSLKGSLLENGGTLTLGRVETRLGDDATQARGIESAVRQIVEQLARDRRPRIVGHRVVHGGTRFHQPVLVDDGVLEGIEAMAGFAPLHNPVAAQVIRAARSALQDVPQVAVFDTAFHATLEPAEYRYPLPARWYEEWGIRRFGFHGISVAWSAQRASELLRRPASELNLVVAHLGNGCSVTAVAGGRSVSTSMGLTPLEGLMMGTRAGSIDPGILLYLLRQGRVDAAGLESALDHESGLVAIASSALEMFAHRAASGIAATATALPSIDALVFTGGIGEHAARVRQSIVARLGVLGLDPIEAIDLNQDGPLSGAKARIAVLRIEAREDALIAREAERLLDRL
jgi:acetate kinase